MAAMAILIVPPTAAAREQWTTEQANAWYAGRPWLVGCNFIPSTAINQLEMWQADTFDPATIDRELGWAEGLGFNSVRVFLHHLLWEQDREGFLKRIDQFLADRRQAQDRRDVRAVRQRLGPRTPKLGKQRAPKPDLHNSGWVQSPGPDDPRRTRRGTTARGLREGRGRPFKDDKRVHAWDLFNEPDNTNGSSYGKHRAREQGRARARPAQEVVRLGPRRRARRSR